MTPPKIGCKSQIPLSSITTTANKPADNKPASIFLTYNAKTCANSQNGLSTKIQQNVKPDKNETDNFNKILESRINSVTAKLQKAEKENGLIGKAWSWTKNKIGFGDSSNKVREIQANEKKLLAQFNSDEKARTKVFKELTGFEYNNENLDKFIKGQIKLKSEIALEKYKEGQEMAVDITSDIVSGIVAYGTAAACIAGGIAAAPFTAGASLGAVAVGVGIAAGAGAATKVAIKGGEAAVGGKKYSLKQAGKDATIGAVSGALAPVTVGAGGAVANSVGKTAPKFIATSARLSVEGATFGGVDGGVRSALEGDSLGKIGLNTLKGAGVGALAGNILGHGGNAVGKIGKKVIKNARNIGTKLTPKFIKNTKNYFNSLVDDSKKAMEELNSEIFNSKTLHTFFEDSRFISTEPNTFMLKSTTTGEPVKVYMLKETTHRNKTKRYCINLYKEKPTFQESYTGDGSIGYKNFSITTKSGQNVMEYGMMSSNPNSDLIGAGIRTDQFQIETALQNNIKRIPRTAYPSAILYHLKMGFKPIQKLNRVHSPKNLDELMLEMYQKSVAIPRENYTPIIVTKQGLFGKRYYLDENTTQAIAAMRTVKTQPPKTGSNRSNFILGENIELELSGDRLTTWENMLNANKIKGTNIDAITSDNEFDDVLNRFKPSFFNRFHWNSTNFDKYERALMPYCGFGDMHGSINEYLRTGKITENTNTSIGTMDDVIRLIDYSLKKIDKKYGNYQGIVYRYGFMGNKTQNYVSTACSPIGAVKHANINGYYSNNEPFNIIFTKHGHKINEMQKQLAIDAFSYENEILLDPGRHFQRIKDNTSEISNAKQALLEAMKAEGINIRRLPKIYIWQEIE